MFASMILPFCLVFVFEISVVCSAPSSKLLRPGPWYTMEHEDHEDGMPGTPKEYTNLAALKQNNGKTSPQKVGIGGMPETAKLMSDDCGGFGCLKVMKFLAGMNTVGRK